MHVLNIDTITALNVFNNPYDLEICITKNTPSLYIARGPLGGFEPCSSTPISADRHAAAEEARAFLEALRLTGDAQSAMAASHPAARFAHGGKLPVLTRDIIDNIVADLHKKGSAFTYDYHRES